MLRTTASATLSALLFAMPAAPQPATGAGTGVTVYRCSDSQGQLVALRDSPCRNGERQEVVTMQRPQDPPPRTASTAAPPAPPPAGPPVREVRVVTVQAPRPMYECTAPDGSTYTSDSDEGNQRWVPLWTLGYPVGPGPRPPPRPGLPPVRPASTPSASALPAPSHGGRPGPGPRPPLHGVVVPGGTWVRDPCIRLSQEEICSRLSDRRYEILRVYHAAMPSQREELDREQRQIDAHLADHCSGH